MAQAMKQNGSGTAGPGPIRSSVKAASLSPLPPTSTMDHAARYDRDGSDLVSQGLYLDMPPWSYHVLQLTT